MSLVTISGPAGTIEARYHTAPFKAGLSTVLLVPPHPEREGDMGHKVIYSLYRSFASLRFNVLRFNYRGCGKSSGNFTDGEEEISDASACLDWLSTHNPGSSQCWVAGFSFGAWISMQLLMRRPECHRFISISPPVTLYDFSFLAPCPAPGLIIHGENDEVVSKEAVVRFVHQLSLQKKGHHIDLKVVPDADHHFKKTAPDIEKLVSDYIQTSSLNLSEGIFKTSGDTSNL